MASIVEVLFRSHKKIKPHEEKLEYSDETMKLLKDLKKKHGGSISTPKNTNVV
jgi:hypothetical protein